jgi:hypothetical protein
MLREVSARQHSQRRREVLEWGGPTGYDFPKPAKCPALAGEISFGWQFRVRERRMAGGWRWSLQIPWVGKTCCTACRAS